MSWSATGTSGAQAFSKAYTYDQLNRLATMSGTGGSCTGLSWTYDAWGNRTDQSYTGGTCNTSHLGFDPYNRLNSPSGFTYDAAGNLLGDGTYTYSYDAEERLISVGGLSSASYVYDAMGRRVQRTVGSSSAYYLYDLDGNVTSDILPSGGDAADYIFAGGRLVAEYASGTTYFVHQDHLGSTRLLTGVSGTVQDCYAYYPFGETDTTICNPTYNALDRFTGFRFDPETNLYDTLSRKFTSAQGRFLSPDEPFIDQSELNPQSWNLYGYVRNNPLGAIDPDGHACVDVSGGKADDGTGGGCPEAGVDKDGNETSQEVKVNGQAPLSADEQRISDFAGEMNKRPMAKFVGAVAGGGAIVGATGGAALYYFSSAATVTTLGITAARAAPLLPVVAGALEKLQKLGISVEAANEIVASPESQKLVDNLRDGNINVVKEVGGQLVRITLNPGGTRIISAGLVRANQIANGIANGRFVPK
jgi:RHS repeat-associated protein